MIRKVSLFAVLVALTGAPAIGQAIGEWDADGDGLLDEAEFTQSVLESGVFEQWDTDEDDAVGYSELSSGLYATWDASDDGELSVDEWDGAVDLWFGEFDVDLSAENWDADADGVISEAEFADALEETDLLTRLSGEDGTLGEDELASGLFNIADTDEDDLVGAEEDGFFTDVAEFFAPEEEPSAVADEDASDPIDDTDEITLIEEGEAFMQLPIPCGDGETGCEAVADRFCSTLGYGKPIDFLDVGGELYAIRCQDEI